MMSTKINSWSFLSLSCSCVPRESTATNPSVIERRSKTPSKNKTSKEGKDGVIRFINFIKKYKSHYGRVRSAKKYLQSNFNIAKLYEQYKKSCEIIEANAVSDFICREIFNNEFNLTFKHRHSDTCKTCDRFKTDLAWNRLSGEEWAKIQQEKSNQGDLGNRILEEREEYIEKATKNGDTMIITIRFAKNSLNAVIDNFDSI